MKPVVDIRARTRRRTALVGVIAVFAVPLALITTASSDQANPPTVTKATVVGSAPPQVDIVPNGPLAGLANGTTVSITVSGPAGKFFGADVRLCMGGVNIAFQSDFNPTQGGNCIDQPLNAQSDSVVTVSAAPTNVTATALFRVGTGSRTFNAGGSPTTITCDASHDCALWLKESVDTSLNQTGFFFSHYDLKFGSGGSTTTTSSSTTTSSTSVPPPTTTTSSSTTTTSSSVPPSTTTTSSLLPHPTTTITPVPRPPRVRLMCRLLRVVQALLPPFLRHLLDSALLFFGCRAR